MELEPTAFYTVSRVLQPLTLIAVILLNLHVNTLRSIDLHFLAGRVPAVHEGYRSGPLWY